MRRRIKKKRTGSCHILENLLVIVGETSNVPKGSEYGKSFDDLRKKKTNKCGKGVVIARLGNTPVVKAFPA